jgi:hypothetical protein
MLGVLRLELMQEDRITTAAARTRFDANWRRSLAYVRGYLLLMWPDHEHYDGFLPESPQSDTY